MTATHDIPKAQNSLVYTHAQLDTSLFWFSLSQLFPIVSVEVVILVMFYFFVEQNGNYYIEEQDGNYTVDNPVRH